MKLITAKKHLNSESMFIESEVELSFDDRQYLLEFFAPFFDPQRNCWVDVLVDEETGWLYLWTPAPLIWDWDTQSYSHEPIMEGTSYSYDLQLNYYDDAECFQTLARSAYPEGNLTSLLHFPNSLKEY